MPLCLEASVRSFFLCLILSVVSMVIGAENHNEKEAIALTTINM